MAGRERPYLAYLLRLWLVEGDGPVWRATLENPTTAERHGFASLDQLVAFLRTKTRDLAEEERWERKADVAGAANGDALTELLGRAMSDEEFRSLLMADPAGALKEGGFDLSVEQLAALLDVDKGSIVEGLDQRLSKRLGHDSGLPW